MEIVETSVFTECVKGLLPDDEYRKLQAVLAGRPFIGKVIRGTGGLRKYRWGLGEKGKRGGVRVIYYWAVSKDTILMLLIYPKSEKDDLTSKQVRQLKALVREEYP